MKKLLITLFLVCLPAFAVGTVTQSVSPIGIAPSTGPDLRTYVVAISWTADAANGSVPSTALAIAPFPAMQGMRISSVEYQPGSPSPTANYAITLTDANGADMLNATGAALSATLSSFSSSIVSPPVNGVPTFNLSGNSVNSAQGKITIYFVPLSVAASARGMPATLAANNTFSGINVHTGTETFANFNKVIYVDQQAGVTADVKFANACSALPASGGVLDARGFGAGIQSIAATVSCGSLTQPVTFIFDPSTNFQPSTANLNIFQVNDRNVWDGLLRIDATNQAAYSGNAIQVNSSAAVGRAWVRARVVMPSGGTGPCFAYSSTATFGAIFSDYDITCEGIGTGAIATNISSGGTSFFNGNRVKLTVINVGASAAKYCLQGLVTSTTGAIVGNKFDIHCEMNSNAGALAGVHLNSQATGNGLAANRFELDTFDIQGANNAVLIDGTNGVCGNYFIGILANGSGAAVSDNGNCGVNLNEYHDLMFRTARVGGVFSSPLRATLEIADQGTACTNGELALSAGWQSTGTATVTAAAGLSQTCSWTITTGTTTAANPTVTDTLTNALPAATTVCEMNIHGGTHTAAAGEGFQQTTLSATAPIFTFNGTPTAGGTTYFVTRRCGP